MSERIQEPGKEGQRLEPRAINHGFARGADGLASSVGPKWGKLGAWRRGVARPRPAAPWQERPLEEGMARRLPPEQQDEPPSEDEIKMLGTEGKFLRERSVRLCGDPKAGETESGGSAAASGGAITVLLSVAVGPALCCAPEAPAPSPAHCPCGSGRCLPTQHCGAGGAGRRRGDPDLALSWEEPCRAQAQSPGGAYTTAQNCPPPPAPSLLANASSGLRLALSEHHSATRLIHIFPPFPFKLKKKKLRG